MKRRIFATVLALGVIGAVQAGCTPHRDRAAGAARAPDGWVTPPLITSAQRTATGLTVRGQAASLGRVVLRGDGDRAYATGADSGGRFELKVETPMSDAVFVVETQNGQDAAPAPYRLFVTRDPGGPMALLTPGAPSRRLDGAAAGAVRLDAVDTDGHTLLLSGRGRPGAEVAIALAGRLLAPIRVGGDGGWTAQPGGGAGALDLSVDGVAYAYPGLGGELSDATGTISVHSDAAGWTVAWATPGGGSQISWFPAARP